MIKEFKFTPNITGVQYLVSNNGTTTNKDEIIDFMGKHLKRVTNFDIDPEDFTAHINTKSITSDKLNEYEVDDGDYIICVRYKDKTELLFAIEQNEFERFFV